MAHVLTAVLVWSVDQIYPTVIRIAESSKGVSLLSCRGATVCVLGAKINAWRKFPGK